MKKKIGLMVLIIGLLFTGCGGTGQDGQILGGEDQPSSLEGKKVGTVEVYQKLFDVTATTATSDIKMATGTKRGGSLIIDNNEIKNQIMEKLVPTITAVEFVFYDYDEFYSGNGCSSLYVFTFDVIDGAISGSMKMEERKYHILISGLQNNRYLLYDESDIEVATGQTTKLQALLKLYGGYGIETTIKNFPGSYLSGKTYAVTYTADSNVAWISEIQIDNGYANLWISVQIDNVDIVTSTSSFSVTDENGITYMSKITVDPIDAIVSGIIETEYVPSGGDISVEIGFQEYGSAI